MNRDISMTYLFSTAGLAALHTCIGQSPLYAFDLDGTLAPIVADPGCIWIPDDIRHSLMRLNQIAPVAVITGRSRADALTHLGFTPRILVGNHGAEGLPGEETGRDFARLCQGWKEQLILLMPDMSSQGITLDEKGESIALHYRQAPDPARAIKNIRSAIARLSPQPRIVTGIFVKNLLPSGARHKGEALEILMQHLSLQSAVYAGDDTTDEDIFRMNNPSIMGIRVGADQESAAGYYLKGQHEMARLLEEILSRIDLRN